MASRKRIYRGSIRAFSVVFIVLGALIVAVTLSAGGGPLSIGMMMGVAFVAVGAGRLWAASRMDG